MVPTHIAAILRAQWLSMWKLGSGERIGGRILAIVPAVLWYAMWAATGVVAALVIPYAGRDEIGPILAWSFLALFLYWQIAPMLTGSRGAALELNKLLIYPMPEGQLFFIEVLLRITTGAECMLVLAGLTVGIIRHDDAPLWGASIAALLFTAMNLLLAAGLRNLLDRVLSYRRVREVAALAAVILIVLPQTLTVTGVPGTAVATFWDRHPGVWPWAAAGRLAMGDSALASSAVLLLWTAGAWAFGLRQFRRRLRFDPSEAGAAGRKQSSRVPWPDRLYRVPSLMLPDPTAAILEKELRSLARSPRFRVLFVMGFSFGLLVWFPMAKQSGGFTDNFPVVVSVYSLLLLGEPLIWNVFGFDRASAQYYFSTPVAVSRVLAAKNMAAFLFVLAEISIVLALCALLPFRLDPGKVLEAYAITLALMVYLSAAGNLTSVYSPRAVNPEQSWGGTGAGKMQFLILLLYPVLGTPLILAYAARYAFESEAAFYAVLAAVALMGLIIRSVATETALAAAAQRREQFLAALSSGGGPMAQ